MADKEVRHHRHAAFLEDKYNVDSLARKLQYLCYCCTPGNLAVNLPYYVVIESTKFAAEFGDFAAHCCNEANNRILKVESRLPLSKNVVSSRTAGFIIDADQQLANFVQ